MQVSHELGQNQLTQGNSERKRSVSIHCTLDVVMAARPVWKGYLKLSLVSCAVAMFTATSTSNRIRLHIINRLTGHRIRNQIVDAKTGDVVAEEDRVKGFETDHGRHVLLE